MLDGLVSCYFELSLQCQGGSKTNGDLFTCYFLVCFIPYFSLDLFQCSQPRGKKLLCISIFKRIRIDTVLKVDGTLFRRDAPDWCMWPQGFLWHRLLGPSCELR